MGSKVVVGVHVPFHPHRGSGHDGHARLFLGFVLWGDDRPKAQPCEGSKISRPEVLFSDEGNGEVSKGPSPYIHLHASVVPSILQDEPHEADAAKADA